ncbi:hypothetical protein Dimus_020710, partial [Dionaea muscipula]
MSCTSVCSGGKQEERPSGFLCSRSSSHLSCTGEETCYGGQGPSSYCGMGLRSSAQRLERLCDSRRVHSQA